MVGGAGQNGLGVWADFAFCAFHGLLIMFCVPGPLEMENGEKSLWTICVRSGRTSCGAVCILSTSEVDSRYTRLKREQDGESQCSYKRHLKKFGL